MKTLILFLIFLNGCSIFSDGTGVVDKDCSDWYNYYYTNNPDPTKVLQCRYCWGYPKQKETFEHKCFPRGKITEEERKKELEQQRKTEYYDPVLKNIQKQNDIVIQIIK